MQTDLKYRESSQQLQSSFGRHPGPRRLHPAAERNPAAAGLPTIAFRTMRDQRTTFGGVVGLPLSGNVTRGGLPAFLLSRSVRRVRPLKMENICRLTVRRKTLFAKKFQHFDSSQVGIYLSFTCWAHGPDTCRADSG